MSQFKSLFLILSLLALAACGGNTVPDPDPTDSTTVNDDAGLTTDSFGQDGYDDGSALDDPFASGEIAMVIYFDFDSSEVRPQDVATVEAHAGQLTGNRQYEVRLEGHADERGSREYNIGLGERRAQAVRRLLLLQGASAAQISTVSFGEERPAADGSDEASYALNRRVEINYQD